jgi:hypothetical protein
MKLMIFSAITLVLASAVPAQACSYFIDMAKKGEELKAVALAGLQYEQLVSAEVKSAKFFESKPTRMCPDEITYDATIDVAYRTRMNMCIVSLQVRKVEPWDTETSDTDTYTITGRCKAACKKEAAKPAAAQSLLEETFEPLGPTN